MLTTKAVSVWLGMPEKQVRRHLPEGKKHGEPLTDRQGLILAIAAFLDINFQTAEDFYYKYRRKNNGKQKSRSRMD